MKRRSLVLMALLAFSIAAFGFTLPNDGEFIGKGIKLDIILNEDGKEINDTVYLHDIGTFAFLSRLETLPVPIKVRTVPNEEVLKANGMLTKDDISTYDIIVKIKGKTIRKSFYLHDTEHFTFTSILKKLRISMPEGEIPSRKTLQSNGMNYAHAMGVFLDEDCSCIDKGEFSDQDQYFAGGLEGDAEDSESFVEGLNTAVPFGTTERHFCEPGYVQVCTPDKSHCWCEWLGEEDGDNN